MLVSIDSRSAVSKALAVAVVVVLIVAAAAGILYFVQGGPPKMGFSIASTTNIGTVGEPITFTILPNSSSASIMGVNWNFGDGKTATSSEASSTSYTYSHGGSFLVSAQVTFSAQRLLGASTVTATNNQALFPLQVQQNLSLVQGQETSVPTINFPAGSGQKAPVFGTGDSITPIAGFINTPSNSNWTIKQYTWDFGNGQTKTLTANSSGLPAQNPVVSYSGAGIYPLSLTITTNNSKGATLDVTTFRTLAVQSSGASYALLASSSGVVNPKIITSAEVAPGGPFSFDPAIDYEQQGNEVIANVFQTLMTYNGSSTISFLPVLATQIPTQQNGGISSDLMTYTFNIRNNQYFSNGDLVTAHDICSACSADWHSPMDRPELPTGSRQPT